MDILFHVCLLPSEEMVSISRTATKCYKKTQKMDKNDHFGSFPVTSVELRICEKYFG